MLGNCIDTSISRSGSSQWQRVMNALLPANAKVDERDEADLILFAKKYAAYLNHFNENNVADGDWQVFMQMDISVTLAAIAKTNVHDYKNYIALIYNQIKAAGNEADMKKHFKNVFDIMFSLVLELDNYFNQIPGEFDFREYYYSIIQARLQQPVQRIFNYYTLFVSDNYIDASGTFLPADAPLQLSLSQNFVPANLSNPWQPTLPLPTTLLSIPDPVNVSNSIYHIITHNLFNAQLDIILNTYNNLVTQSATFLNQTLSNFPSHTPHYALYIAFIKLFKNAQNELNLFAEKHLDLYYKDVLRLTTKNAVPDSVHLLIELQKGVEQHLIKQGTLFKGGKDADDIDINYAADEETVVNRASIQSLQSICLVPGIITGKSFETVYASPIANSADGQGAKLISAAKGWYPFGDPSKSKVTSLGFMVASHYLYLNEGGRTITFTFTFGQNFSLTTADLSNAFIIDLSGKKDWHTVTGYTASLNTVAKTITIGLTLAADDPAIVGYTEKVHKANYATGLPVARFMLNITPGVFDPYSALKNTTLVKVNIEVAVTGLKDVILSNDAGGLDASKPFLPFGAQPRVGSAFIMGSKEIFQKKLTRLSIVIDWDEVPVSFVDGLDEALHEYERTLSYVDVKRKFHTVKTSVLDKGVWNLLDGQKGIFIEDNLYNIIYNWTRPDSKYAAKLTAADVENAVVNITPKNIIPTPNNYDKNEAYSNKAINGFIKLELNSPDFGHTAYPAALQNAAQSVKVAVTGAGTANMTMSVTPTSTLPTKPYTPKAKSFSINYTASTQIDLQTPSSAFFEGKQGGFYHITPFGYGQVNKVVTAATTIFPAYNNQGELFIGIQNLLPSSTLKVLFQIADGTSNPLKVENTVQWHYLENNKWIPFIKTDVTDATKNFTQSGMVTFTLSNTINNGNTLLDGKFYWIKAFVVNNIDAVCRLIDVQAQAIKATLATDEAKGIFFKNSLAPSAISKLLIADAAIKKINQPYSSFKGKVKEVSAPYYTRVSERLRHKQRAIAVNDYEKIVLEEFPAVYKAKCIHHAGLIPTKVPGTTRYSETAPGNVTVVTIPDLRNQSFTNPLKPYTSIGLLTNIKGYLSNLISPFVKLHVLNPLFEEVQFQFDVTIRQPLDEAFYVKQLSLDIEQFLCPWAYNNGSDIEFGGKISKSVVLNFIEERHYVEYVVCFQMNHFVGRGTTAALNFYNIEEAITTTGMSILVAYFDEKTNTRHLINTGVPCPC